MEVAIVHNPNPLSIELAQQLQELLIKAGNKINPKAPQLVISIGGDGTLLTAFHRYVHLLHKVRFVGVHTGHLGFYTDWRDYELEELVQSLAQDAGESVSYPLLDVTVSYYDSQQPEQHFLALNESNLRRMNITMVSDVYIKDELFERFRGDGLTVATPTGSTAYSKSSGGAVMHPSINALQLTEIASINNRVYRTLGSPLIISGDEWIRLELQRSDDYVLTIDQLNWPHTNIKSVVFKIAQERIHFASYRHTHFWRRVKDAFIGDF